MSQSLAQIYIHLVFSTKYRHPWLTDPETRDVLHRYLAGACHNLDCPALKIGGVEDHVHLLCRFAKTLKFCDFVRELKRESSKWIKTQGRAFDKFEWQNGYGAFSVGYSQIPGVQFYIENQVEHHRRESYQDEFRRLCRENGVELDERYAWD